MYRRSGPEHPLIRVILHPQLLNVSTKEPSYLKGWSTKMCGKGQSSSLKLIADVYSIGWKRVYPLASPDAHPLAESVRELYRTMGEFMTITQ